MTAVINRLKDNDERQSLGHFILYDNEKIVFECKTLELPDKSNKRNISRIPKGKYRCILRYSEKFQWHYHVENVKDRTWILIHFGNTYNDIRGCILLGSDFKDINNDGSLDVINSKQTLSYLLDIAPKDFTLVINDLDNWGI